MDLDLGMASERVTREKWRWVGEPTPDPKPRRGRKYYNAVKVTRRSDGSISVFSIGNTVLLNANGETATGKKWMAQIINLYEETAAEYNRQKASREIKETGPGVDRNSLAYKLMRCTVRWFELAVDLPNARKRQSSKLVPRIAEHEYYISDHVEKDGFHGVVEIRGRAWPVVSTDCREAFYREPDSQFLEDYDLVCVVRCFVKNAIEDKVRNLGTGELVHLLSNPTTARNLFDTLPSRAVGRSTSHDINSVSNKRRKVVNTDDQRFPGGQEIPKPSNSNYVAQENESEILDYVNALMDNANPNDLLPVQRSPSPRALPPSSGEVTGRPPNAENDNVKPEVIVISDSDSDTGPMTCPVETSEVLDGGGPPIYEDDRTPCDNLGEPYDGTVHPQGEHVTRPSDKDPLQPLQNNGVASFDDGVGGLRNGGAAKTAKNGAATLSEARAVDSLDDILEVPLYDMAAEHPQKEVLQPTKPNNTVATFAKTASEPPARAAVEHDENLRLPNERLFGSPRRKYPQLSQGRTASLSTNHALNSMNAEGAETAKGPVTQPATGGSADPLSSAGTRHSHDHSMQIPEDDTVQMPDATEPLFQEAVESLGVEKPEVEDTGEQTRVAFVENENIVASKQSRMTVDSPWSKADTSGENQTEEVPPDMENRHITQHAAPVDQESDVDTEPESADGVHEILKELKVEYEKMTPEKQELFTRGMGAALDLAIAKVRQYGLTEGVEPDDQRVRKIILDVLELCTGMKLAEEASS